MEQALPTVESHSPSLIMHQHTVQHTHVPTLKMHRVVSIQLAGTFQGKEGGIQALAGLVPSSQTI
jgi:hypothetical protein